MTIVAHHHPFVIGVDTHARTHALAILACPTAEVFDQAQFPTTTAGLRRALAWVGRRTAGDLDVLWVIEGTGTYGARLAHAATETGYTVVEAPRMDSRNCRTRTSPSPSPTTRSCGPSRSPRAGGAALPCRRPPDSPVAHALPPSTTQSCCPPGSLARPRRPRLPA
ncbi:IS110 family transposase [Luteococcus japonicus]|uniref:IS110 family transposase n=1 Tax=Luteococcus japonicus TaxID=33984 RepID=UPI001B873C3A|nr:transposase [Luteococcus japonicus]